MKRITIAVLIIAFLPFAILGFLFRISAQVFDDGSKISDDLINYLQNEN